MLLVRKRTDKKGVITMGKFKATIYIRLSYTDDKTIESDSVQNQRRILQSFAEQHPDIEIVSEKVDDGYSGIIFERPAFKEMMADIEAGTTNCVIVKDLSRLGREYIETGRYLRRIFPAYGVRFIAINDHIDTLQDSGDDLVISVKSVLNDAYCRDISVKTRSALQAKRESGSYVGACPIYGYTRHPDNRNQLVIDPYPASVVQDIYRQKLQGMSPWNIAQALNELGILSPLSYKQDRGLPTPKGGFGDSQDAKWVQSTILRILKDETYTGILLQGKIGTLNYKLKDRVAQDATQWVRTEMAHEAIITKTDFDVVQRSLRLDTRTSPKSDAVHLFSGLLICGCCGATMTRKTNTVRGKAYHYYYCRTTKKKGCSHSVMIKEETLIECVKETLRIQIAHMVSLEQLLAGQKRQKILDAMADKIRIQIGDNRTQLEKIRGFKSSLYENLVAGYLSKEEYKVFKLKYTKNETVLLQAIDALELELSTVLAGNSERLRFLEEFQSFQTLTTFDRQVVLRFIQSIKVVDKQELEITYHFQNEYEQLVATLQTLEKQSKEVA